jgi:hypothetical protein
MLVHDLPVIGTGHGCSRPFALNYCHFTALALQNHAIDRPRDALDWLLVDAVSFRSRSGHAWAPKPSYSVNAGRQSLWIAARHLLI